MVDGEIKKVLLTPEGSMAQNFGFDRINIFEYSDEETTSAYDMQDKIDEDVIHNRAEILAEIQAEVLEKSLKSRIGKEVDIVIDGESEEHELLLSAKELMWAPEIDGEIYVNDRTDDEAEIVYGKVYKAKITSLVADTLTAKVYN